MAQATAGSGVFGGGFYADTVAKARALPLECRPPEVAAFLQAHALLEQADAVLPDPPPAAPPCPRPLLTEFMAADRARRRVMMAPAFADQERGLVQDDGSEDEQLLAAIKYLRASYTRVPGQPRPLNHPRLTNNRRFAALLSPLKFTVVFDTDESRTSRMERTFFPPEMEDLLRQPSPGVPATLVRSVRLATKLLLLADRELLIKNPPFPRQLLDVVHRSLDDPGAAAAISAQLEAMQRGVAAAAEGADGAGASGAGGGAPAPAQSSPLPAGASLAQLRSLCLAMKLQAWPEIRKDQEQFMSEAELRSNQRGGAAWRAWYAWSAPAAEELATTEPGHLRNLVRLGDRLDDLAQVENYAAAAQQGITHSTAHMAALGAAVRTWKAALADAREAGHHYFTAHVCFKLAAATCAIAFSDYPPAAVDAFLKEGEAAFYACPRSCLPYTWVQSLKELRAEADALRPRAWKSQLLNPLQQQTNARLAALGQRMAEARKDRCDGCGTSSLSLKVCSKCRSASDCSVECQRQAWAAGHKQECQAAQARKSGKPEQQAGGSRRRG
eukprot:scaffold4.g4715.t1